MKIICLSFLLCAEATFGASLGSRFNAEKRQLAGVLGALMSGDTSILGALGNGNYGRQSTRPTGEAPARATLKSDLNVPGVKQIKVRTGPYLVPGMNRQNTFSKHWGMLESYYDTKVEKPCSECNILRQVGGLEYANGTNANIDTGLWLHHMVHFNTGPRRWDPVAYGEGSCLPHEGVNTMGGAALGRGTISARNTERYFVTGNERTPFNFYQPGAGGQGGSAYRLDAGDRFFYLVELMNMNMQDATVYITMTYDITDGPLPQGWQDVKTVFLDANSCKSSEVPSPKGKTQFTVQSKPWRPNVEGRIIDSIGHLHDGGIQIDIMASDSTALCKSQTLYSHRPEYVYRDTGMAMHGDKVAKDHISAMAGCGPKNVSIQKMSKDQSWFTRGTYDYSKRTANLEAGSPSEVMAIAIVLVTVPPGPLKPV